MALTTPLQRYKIQCGDNLELLRDWSGDDALDLIYLDPPLKLDRDEHPQAAERVMADHACHLIPRLREASRLLKPGGHLFLHCINNWITRYDAQIGEIFGQTRPRTLIRWNGPLRDSVLLHISPAGHSTRGDEDWRALSSSRLRPGAPIYHLSQKPPALFDAILQATAILRGFALDPYCGSGGFLEAAARADWDVVGMDIRDIAVDLAHVRLLEISHAARTSPPTPPGARKTLDLKGEPIHDHHLIVGDRL